ncbi:MAG: hypothetical protein WC546_06705, partial [Candidatus Omnitrophota bacterium]
NTLRLTPTDAPLHTVRGAIYYDDSENMLKYYDAANWRNVGVTWPGSVVTPEPFVNIAKNKTNEVTCPPDSVITGVEILGGGGSNCPCPRSCAFHARPIQRITLICTQLQ